MQGAKYDYSLQEKQGLKKYGKNMVRRSEMKGNAMNRHPERSLSVHNHTRQALLKRGALQNAILNSENFSSIATDEKGVIQLFNVGAEHMLGYTASEVLDKLTPADISDPQESGKMELELSRFLLKDVLSSSMNMFKEKMMKHNIKLGLEIEPEADIEIEADERKLKQIMFNLLSNAVKFTPDGGSVRVQARLNSELEKDSEDSALRIHHSAFDRDFIEISVIDTGIGIKTEDMPKLFKEFTQLESAYTRNFEGTGLGLALTKRLVELHNGKIWVESEFGKGSMVTFVIPVIKENE